MQKGLLILLTCPLCLFAACGGTPKKSGSGAAAAQTGAAASGHAATSGAAEPATSAQKPTPKAEAAAAAKEKQALQIGAQSSSQEGRTLPPPSAGEKRTDGTAPEATSDDGRSAREHVLEAMRLLDRGDPETAWIELTAALKQEPDNETATSLMKQMDTDPEELLGKEHFSYTTQGGDTLSKIAKRFLNDDRKFYALARYNGIRVPRDLAAGQVLKIPGKRPAGLPKPTPAPTPAPAPVKEPAAVPSKAPAPVAVPKEAPPPPQPASTPAKAQGRDGEPSADKLYQGGVQALSAGAPDRAYELLSQALKVNPKHTAAQDKLREIKPAAVEAYYKKAMASLRRHDLDETIRYCNRALELDPDNEKVKLRRAEALELQEKMKNLK